ncbi:transcriptional regulator [Aerococcus sp. HMSC035B07]|uniref:PTS sugar transporter subunit IIC n=1 Tax=Aerococcus sp. HMSC035B07 TaxID=1715184 RepID=UPI0008A9DF3D|nr:PTS sugar transporter subunit IIC [Aerococcus sp. HMSC035B07]OHO43039.1 transcriptional regulator [Aerococcus sp. HMSC035B07]
MDLIIGVALLILVLALFTLFTFKAPKGRETMGAFADASCATLLVEAFLNSFVGNIFDADFFSEVGMAAGSMGGAAAACMIPLALGASPVAAMLCGAATFGLGILPGLVAGYTCYWILQYIEKKLPAGLDLLVMIIVVAPLARFIAIASEPVVEAALLNIGKSIEASSNAAPAIMGIIVGGIMAVVSSSPISSMALSAMLGLTGLPMGVTTMAVFGSAFVNWMTYRELKLGGPRESLAVFLEAKTQVDLTSANPFPVYLADFIGGGLCGLVVALAGMVNEASSTATPFAGLAVMFAYNPAMKVVIMAVACALIGLVTAYISAKCFKNYPINRLDDLKAEADSEEADGVSSDAYYAHQAS